MTHTLLAGTLALDAAAAAVAAAVRLGCSGAASVSAGAGLSVTVRSGEVETIEHHRDKALSVTVYHGHQKGTATTTDFSENAIEETVAAAVRIAQQSEADPYAGLVDPAYLAQCPPDLDLDHPWDISAAAAIDLACDCEAAAREVSAEVTQVDEASVSHYRGLQAYADSQGFAGSYLGTRNGISCVVVGERGGAMQRGYWYTAARAAGELEAARAVGRRAAERTVAKLGAIKLTTRRAPVLFEARIATSLIGHLVAAVSGGNLYREASFLRKAAGTQVFPAFLSIDEQPHLPRALGSAPFDGEGVATRQRKLVEAGTLMGYVLDSYAARRLELTPTGHAGGTHNLIVSDQGRDFDGLVRHMGTGLIVTDLMGFGVNLLTGDYSRGASGFWVENGEIVYPVEEITIAGSLSDMFRNLVATGNDLELRSGTRTGSILLAEMTIAGDQ